MCDAQVDCFFFFIWEAFNTKVQYATQPKKKGPYCVLLAQTDEVKRNGSNLWQILRPTAQIRDTDTDRQRLKEKERRGNRERKGEGD